MPGYTAQIEGSGPSDDGNQTCGIMIHKEILFGGEPASLISWVSMCYTLTRRGELKRLNKAPIIINGGARFKRYLKPSWVLTPYPIINKSYPEKAFDL